MWKYLSSYMKVYLKKKKPELWSNDQVLHHDNAPVHKTLYVKQFMAQKSIIEVEHSLFP